MHKYIITFGDKEIKKHKSHRNKNSIFSTDINAGCLEKKPPKFKCAYLKFLLSFFSQIYYSQIYYILLFQYIYNLAILI